MPPPSRTVMPLPRVGAVKEPGRSGLAGRAGGPGVHARASGCGYLVDPASSICLSQSLSHACVSTHGRYSETANGSLNQLWFLWSLLSRSLDNLEPIARPRGGDDPFECLPYQLSMVLSVPTMVTTGDGESGFDSGEGA
uniref:Uncharacterized protein n=1 Tax=Calidris pygmaea TaxID=425635 RepID=A0A8C3JBQ4_9CHAR